VPPDTVGRRGRVSDRLAAPEVEDLVSVVRDEWPPVGSDPEPNPIPLLREVSFENGPRELNDLDGNRGALAERAHELRRVDDDHERLRPMREQLLAEQGPATPFRHVEGGRDLVRTIHHHVESVVPAQRPDGDMELPGQLLGRARARHAVEFSIGKFLRHGPDGLSRGGSRAEGDPMAGLDVMLDRVAGGDRLGSLEVFRHNSPESVLLFNPALPRAHSDKRGGISRNRMAAPAPPERAPVVVSIGGSVLLTGDGDVDYLGKLADLLRRLGSERPLVVTVGGGRTAREYIQVGRALGLTEVELDEVGIEVTRLHARLLAARVGPPTPAHPPATVAAVVEQLRHGSPIILGGTEPGHTTDGVAALVAVRIRAARVVNATNVDGIYDRDPWSDPKAHRIERLTWPEFRAMVHAGASGEAGQNFLFDRLGVDALARARIPLLVVPGRDLSNLEVAIAGRPCHGSRVGEGPG